MLFFKLSCFSLTAMNSHETLHLALNSVEMKSAAASLWMVAKFSYSSFRVCFRNFLKSIKLVSYSYSILISNITIGE